MNQKPEMSSTEIEQLLISMATNNTLDVDLSDAEIDLLVMNIPSVNRAEQLGTQALLKMQAAQRKREQRLPSFALGQFLADARLAMGLTVHQVAKEVAISTSEIEALESGTWFVDQIIQKFPSKVMVRLLRVIKLTVEDFADKLIEVTNKASLKFNQSTVYARSGKALNSKSVQMIEVVTEYIGELQHLSS
ncbi:MAG: helix-turn-helix domain-containing protein [Anaerolineae bacterium]|nr:helix-turn-helix domain-containing protein [Anaerolineae bacterium]